MENISASLYILDTYKLSEWKKTEYCTDSMQYLIFTFFIEIGLYSLIKINISKWLFNNKIFNLFLTKRHDIFLKHLLLNIYLFTYKIYF